MIPFFEIKKQLCSDPKILDHYIMTEENVIEHIRERVIITNEVNDIEISKEDADVIAKEYFENNKEEFKYVIRRHFDYITDSDKWMRHIDFEEPDVLKKI